MGIGPVRAPLHPAGQGSVIWAVLDIGTIRFQLGILLHRLVNGPLELGEAPFLGNVDLRNKLTAFIYLKLRVIYVEIEVTF